MEVATKCTEESNESCHCESQRTAESQCEYAYHVLRAMLSMKTSRIDGGYLHDDAIAIPQLPRLHPYKGCDDASQQTISRTYSLTVSKCRSRNVEYTDDGDATAASGSTVDTSIKDRASLLTTGIKYISG